VDSERLEKILIPGDATVRQAIESIDAGAIEIALVVGDRGELAGTVTDGDVRRALLRGVALDDSIDPIMHRTPVTAPAGTDRAALLQLMTERAVDQIPLISEGQVVDIAFIRDLVREGEMVGHEPGHPVVLMAGGRGQRLRPLTEQTPKPMLPVGGRPLLERVLEQVRDAGFSRVLMAINYRADVIEKHFGDGSRFGVEIAYLREDRPLGSAGALRLAGTELDRPFVVMNADLLTNVNLAALMRFHREEDNAVTVGVRQYVLELPYGVVELDGTRLVALREKPKASYLVNTGVYAVNPSVLSLMPDSDEPFDMTDVIDAGLSNGLRVGGFPLREYWLDIGQLSDYERAESDHATYFSTRG
jgi:dTDP-glucose pyrophosphorylase